MLFCKSAGAVLFLTFLMLCGVAAAEVGGFRDSEDGLAGANFDLTLSPSSTIGYESVLTDGIDLSCAWSQPRTWTLSILAHGMEGYVLTAVVTGTGRSGFTGLSLQSTIATPEGYFGAPIALASNPVPTSYVSEPASSGFMITGIFFTGGMLRHRIAPR
jgi:hypothetical protein